MQTCICTCILKYIYVCVCMHECACMHACMHVCLYVYACFSTTMLCLEWFLRLLGYGFVTVSGAPCAPPSNSKRCTRAPWFLMQIQSGVPGRPAGRPAGDPPTCLPWMQFETAICSNLLKILLNSTSNAKRWRSSLWPPMTVLECNTKFLNFKLPQATLFRELQTDSNLSIWPFEIPKQSASNILFFLLIRATNSTNLMGLGEQVNKPGEMAWRHSCIFLYRRILCACHGNRQCNDSKCTAFLSVQVLAHRKGEHAKPNMFI